jgi:alpha-beta hydrolase superfamily lysophospholipase
MTPTRSDAARRAARTILRFVLPAAALAYAAALALLYITQERLIFPGTPLPANHRFEFTGQRFEEVRIPVPGGSLDALHFTQAHPRGLVFFVHGNAGNLETWTTGVDFYRRINYDLFIFDYRGYGKSTGHIESEAQLMADVRAAWDAIAPRYGGQPIVIYGRSLGTGLAAALARDVSPRLLVLVSPYSSLVALARSRYPFVPEWLVKYPVRTEAVIGEVKSPILIFHGDRDTVIPESESERLKMRAKTPTELVVVAGAGHSDIHRFPAYLDALAARVTALGE